MTDKDLRLENRGLRLPHVKGTLIFEQSWAGSLLQKATTLGVSALFWAFWLSLWLPAATLLLWLWGSTFGLGLVAQHLDDSLPTIVLIVSVGFALAVFLALWGTADWVRAIPRRGEREREALRVDASELARSHGLAEEDLRKAWSSRRVVVHHDPKGRITAVECSLPLETACRPVNCGGLPEEA